jgi:hypothetical protein
MGDNEQLVESWKTDFEKAHGADPKNAARQPFEDYWNWIKVFLITGGAGQRGWLEQGDEVLRAVKRTAAAEDLLGRLRTIGRGIAAEWAKENRSRRVYSTFLQGSPNLAEWGKQLQRAAAADAGDGVAIGKALDAIERELRQAVEG